MFAPPLYTVRKYPLKYIIDNNFNIQHSIKDDKRFNIKQQDNLLFRQIRLITKDKKEFNKYITFVDCKGGQSYQSELTKLVLDGFKLISQDMDISERSASMTRVQILSYVDKQIEPELSERVSMGIKLPKTVLSKYFAYRGLMLSSCHCLENWYPKIIVVPDYYRIIPNQRIKYVYDKDTEFVDKNGISRKWTQKDIAEKVTDIKINVFDGSGIHHPHISKTVKDMIGSKTNMTSLLWRMPFIKGVTHEMDYTKFYEDHGISHIMDIWGVSHSIYDQMIIITESMYKGKKYFEQYKDIRDWEEYWNRFTKYEHCVGVAKWNFSLEEEPLYTRANYQILQDLQLQYDDFAMLALDSIEWATKIIDGDFLYTYCFLGLFADKHKPLNSYCKAILKNPEMLKEYGIRQYFISLISKYIDEFKCGKLWLKSCFKFLVPDLIMMLEWIGGNQNPEGCLNFDEFYSLDIDGVYSGEYAIERNPHICKSEHVILKGVNNNIIKDYCSHLSNICMINGKSITPQRLNGADTDGDLVLVVDHDLFKSGIDINVPVVIDIDDKITALEEEITKENQLNLILRTMNSLIGETSNCATGYHNKVPKTDEQKQKYESYIDLLSVINGKAIDYAKTGVLFNIPRNIAKYSKPLPYFMKYASEYYKKQKNFSRSQSNMNRLCFELEKWSKTIRFRRKFNDFDYSIMIDDSINISEELFSEIESIYLDFCKEMNELGRLQSKLKNYKQYVDEFDGVITYQEAQNTVIDWKYYYNQYKEKCMAICKDQKSLANITVRLFYEKYRNKSNKFMWIVAEEGIINNIKQMNIKLPIRSNGGDYMYLGKKYDIVKVNSEDIHI